MSEKNPAKSRNRPSGAKLRRVVYLKNQYAQEADGVDLSALLEWALSEAPLHRFPKGSRNSRRAAVPDIDAIPRDYFGGGVK